MRLLALRAFVVLSLISLMPTTARAAVTVLTPGVRGIEATAGVDHTCCTLEQDNVSFSAALGPIDITQSAFSNTDPGAASSVHLISNADANGNVTVSVSTSASRTFISTSGATASISVANHESNGFVFQLDTPTPVTLHASHTLPAGVPVSDGVQIVLYRGSWDPARGFRQTAPVMERHYSGSSFTDWTAGTPFDSTMTLQPGVYALQWSASRSAQVGGSTLTFEASMNVLTQAVPAMSPGWCGALGVGLASLGAALLRRRTLHTA
jgi:hypothetical protein